MINCGEDVPVAEFLKIFYDKAAKKKCIMEPKLDFMIKLSDKIDEVKARFEDTPWNYKFIKDFDRGVARLEKVPEEIWHVYVGKKVHQDIMKTIKDIKKDTYSFVDIKVLITRIRYAIAYELPNGRDIVFDSLYRDWRKRSMDEKHLNKIERKIKDWSKYVSYLRNEFEKAMELVDSSNRTLHTFIASANSSIKLLLKLPIFAREQAKQLLATEHGIHEIQDKLEAALKVVCDDLEYFNTERFLWTRFIITKPQNNLIGY